MKIADDLHVSEGTLLVTEHTLSLHLPTEVSFHDLAFNVTLDCEHFIWLQPCGLSGVRVTSVARESKESIDFYGGEKTKVMKGIQNREGIVADYYI